MRGRSKAFISRRLVAHRIAAGVSHSNMVRAYAACVLCMTSMPSCLSASPRRLAKNTLLSISRSFAPALLMADLCRHQVLEIEHFDDFFPERQQPQNIRREIAGNG